MTNFLTVAHHLLLFCQFFHSFKKLLDCINQSHKRWLQNSTAVFINQNKTENNIKIIHLVSYLIN